MAYSAVMFSGGADSTLILDLALKELGKENVIAVYVHFIGQSTTEELKAVLSAAKRLDANIIVHNVVVRNHHKGPEGNARQEFKRVLQSYVENDNYGSIWMGHNKDDHIETVLIQLFRGAGVGTKGIPDQKKGKIYRPILRMTREEVREECRKRNLSWYSDPMNSDDGLTRVFFREKIIPLLKEHYGDGVYRRIDKIAKKIGDINGHRID